MRSGQGRVNWRVDVSFSGDGSGVDGFRELGSILGGEWLIPVLSWESCEDSCVALGRSFEPRFLRPLAVSSS